MADATIWLVGANAIIWIGLGAYLCFMGNRQARLATKIKQMELIGNDRDVSS